MSDHEWVTIKDITALTGFTKAAVTNWRKRFPDFPAPVPASPRRPLYFDKKEVMAWLNATFPERGPARQADTLTAHLNALRAVAPDRYDATLRALQLLTFSTLSVSPPADNTETLTWEILQRSVSPHYAIRRVLFMQNGQLSRAETALYEYLADRAPNSSAAEIAEAIMSTLLSGLSAAESTQHGIVGAQSSRLLGIAAATAAPPSACIYDPVCGTGDSLIHLVPEIQETDVYASDVSPIAAAITTLRLHLHGCTPTVTTQDLLSGDPYPELMADVAIAEAPYSASRRTLTHSNRWPTAWKPTGPHAADIAFLFDAIAHLSADGYGYVITSANLLTARDLSDLRMYLVGNGNVEAVIELPLAVTSTSLPTALWVLRAQGADRTVLIDATEDTMIETHLPEWLSAIRTSEPPTTAHATITSAQMTKKSSAMRAAPYLHPEPTGEEAARRWHSASGELEEALGNLRYATGGGFDGEFRLITPVDVDDRPDFSAAPIVTIKQLLQAGTLRTVKCSSRPKGAPQPGWTREVLVLPVHELDALPGMASDGPPALRVMAQMTGSRSSAKMRVPDDYDAAIVGDIVIPVAGRHAAIAAPLKDMAVTSASRVIRIEDEGALDKWYLLYCINADWNRATSTSGGTHRRAMEDILVPVIPIEDQKDFVTYLDTLESFEELAETAIEQSRELRAATLSAIRFGTID